MSKGGKQTVTNTPDAQTQQQRQSIWDAAANAGNNAPGVAQAGQFYGNTATAGQHGVDALNGDPSAVASFMNPYQKNVVDAATQQFQHNLGLVNNQVNSDATGAGAFGGSRYGVALGTALQGANRDFNSELAGIDQQGYNDAMGRAGQVANLGMGAAGAMAGGAGDPNAYRVNMLNSAYHPAGDTTTTTGKPGGNFGSGVVGGATAGSAFGPWGALIGGGIGGISSLF